MPTIRDIAELAGVSPTTVSFVLNGKAQEKKISSSTCARIEQAMNQLGYVPNLSARRLRSSDESKPIIALFWPFDYRINAMASLINAIQVELRRRTFACEFVVQSYENNNIAGISSTFIKGEYSAAIMGGLGPEDLKFLESVPLTIPVVLINRSLEKVSTVGVNNRSLVNKCISFLEEKGYQRISVACSRNFYYATNQRTTMFLNGCAKRGIQVPEEWILRTENRIDGGIRAAQRLASLSPRPRFVFCDSDAIAYGLVSYCNRHNIRIPENLEVLCVGSILDNSYTAYATPSISTVALPHSRIAASAISLIIDSLAFRSNKPQHILIEPDIFLRDSFRLD